MELSKMWAAVFAWGVTWLVDKFPILVDSAMTDATWVTQTADLLWLFVGAFIAGAITYFSPANKLKPEQIREQAAKQGMTMRSALIAAIFAAVIVMAMLAASPARAAGIGIQIEDDTNGTLVGVGVSGVGDQLTGGKSLLLEREILDRQLSLGLIGYESATYSDDGDFTLNENIAAYGQFNLFFGKHDKFRVSAGVAAFAEPVTSFGTVAPPDSDLQLAGKLSAVKFFGAKSGGFVAFDYFTDAGLNGAETDPMFNITFGGRL